MLPNFFNSSKSRSSMDANKSMEHERQTFGLGSTPDDQAWSTDTVQSTRPEHGVSLMNTDETSTGLTAFGDMEDSLMISHDIVEPGGTASAISPVLTNVQEQPSQSTDTNTFKIERPPMADQIMAPSMINAPFQANNAIPADRNDRFLQPSELVTAEVHNGINLEDTTMEGTSELQVTQASMPGSINQFDADNDQATPYWPVVHDASSNKNSTDQPRLLHSSKHGTSVGAQRHAGMSPVPGEQSQEDSQMIRNEAPGNTTVPVSKPMEAATTSDLMNPETTFSSRNSAGPNVEDATSGAQEASTQVPRTIFADDSVLLIEQQRGRLAKYRPSSEDWQPRKRSASVPPRCVNHYSYVANWPPQKPPRCDFGHRVDVFPSKDAPLHLHMQAYALRWGVWTSEIKDKEIRQQVLDTIGDKMKEAWENAIGDNYYIRPTAPQDDSDHRNDAEEKTKRGRKRAISPSKQSAGFVCEGRDPLAITNGELAEHNLTMDLINQKAQEKDFDAGEQILDEVLTNLGRDRLVIKDWSTFGFHGSVRGRNLLMYSLFVVLECRNERRKLNNLLAHFSKEMQKKNTRARIEMYQEREFQHLALAAELELARREANPEESHVDEESEDGHDDDEMETEDADVASQANENEKTQQDSDHAQQSVPQSAPDNESISDDHDLILRVAQGVLSADSDATLYTTFTRNGMDSTAFATEGGLRTGGDPKLQAGKTILGETFEMITRVISHKEMVKREQNPQEALRMNHDIRLCYQRLLQAQSKLAKALHLDFATASDPKMNSSSLGTKQNEVVGVDHVSFVPQLPQGTSTQTLSQPRDMNALGDHSELEQAMSSSSSPDPPTSSIVNNLNTAGQQRIYSPNVATASPVPISQNVALTPQNVSFVGDLQPQIQNPVYNVPLSQQTQNMQQQVPSPSQAIQPALTEDAAAKRAYIDEKWRPWLDSELQKHGKPPSQGVITDWPQLRDTITGLGYTASDRNQLLRNFKSQFEQWMVKKQTAQQSTAVSQSPALSRASLSPALQAVSSSGVPPGWPSNTEIAASIPPTGIHANHLLQKFQHRVGRYVNQFSQLIQQVGFMDQSYVVYPSQQHAAMARQQPTTLQPPAPSSPRPLSATSKPHQIVKLKLPQTLANSAASLPPAQDESNFSQDFQSTEVNTTRGFSFRYLPHSTLEQRKTIDDLIAEYTVKTSKARRKGYYGTYVTFNDPQDPSGPPIAHGFWDFKDGSRPEGSEWFYGGEDVPVEWLPRLGIKGDEESETGDGEQDGQYRDVWNDQQGRYVKFKLAGPVQGHGQGRAPSHQAYNTYPPGYNNAYTNVSPNQLSHQNLQPRLTKPQPSRATRGRSGYLDGNDDEGQDSHSAGTGPGPGPRTRKRAAGTKRGSSAVGGSGDRGSRGGQGNAKRRKKNPLADDEDDGDYVPGGE